MLGVGRRPHTQPIGMPLQPPSLDRQHMPTVVVCSASDLPSRFSTVRLYARDGPHRVSCMESTHSKRPPQMPHMQTGQQAMAPSAGRDGPPRIGSISLFQLLLQLLLLLLPLSKAASSSDDNEPRILLDIGPNLGEAIPLRLRHYLRPWLVQVNSPQHNASQLAVDLVRDGLLRGRRKGTKKSPVLLPPDAFVPPLAEGRRLLVLALGDGAVARALREEHDSGPWSSFDAGAAGRPGESFALLSLVEGPWALLAGDGLPIDACWNASTRVNTGAAYAAYEALQRLGFAFWHPLEGSIAPTTLAWPAAAPAEGGHGEWVWESPRWRSRNFHLHTQHPLELTDVLQGFDLPLLLDRGPVVDTSSSCSSSSAWEGLRRAETTWMLPKRLTAGEQQQPPPSCSAEGQGGGKEEAAADDPCRAVRARGQHCELWEEMVPDVASFFEWAIAHRLNRVEWILLGNRRWGAIVDSPLRQARLSMLARVGQGFGLMVGVDDPIAFQQQHSWVMTSTLGPWARQLAAVRARVDWLLGGAGLDFLATESGLSEFSHPNDKLMLALMDAFADRANGTWGKEATVKVHISSNQQCRHFRDPRNASQPLNFNFLPTYATPKLGVLPHTVQAYALDDPTAGVYGQRDFTEMHAYLRYEAAQGRRQVHFYPETSYWVNVDTDVPLFLPIYAERRLHDLRLLAHEEDGGRTGGRRIAGTVMFDSGWEWGYWLSGVLVSSAMWDATRWDTDVEEPEVTSSSSSSSSSSSTCLDGDLPPHLRRFERQAREHALRALPPRFRGPLARWLADVAHFEHETLLLGRLGPGRACPNQATLSGIAYLIGKDTWVELPRWLGLGFTQPDYVGMYDHAHPDYAHVRPLLERMRGEGRRLHAAVAAVVGAMEEDDGKAEVPEGLLVRVRELRDAMHLVALRAEQVALLYAATAPGVQASEEGRARRAVLLREARAVLEKAGAIVRVREARYEAPLGRVAGWRENPTVYPFDFLWTVKSLYFWWRDQGQAEAQSWAARYSFCYLNRMQPTEVALGVGKTVLKLVRDVASWVPGAHFWADCLAPPTREFEFPRDL